MCLMYEQKKEIKKLGLNSGDLRSVSRDLAYMINSICTRDGKIYLNIIIPNNNIYFQIELPSVWILS